ncbi:exonuclease [Xanthomonas phage vB_XooS_NR08]|nr:exonuclease [Xanthomonas phage vB_XooS_NR08]
MLTDKQRAWIEAQARRNPMPLTQDRPIVAGMPLHVDGDYLAYYCSGNDDTSPSEAKRASVDMIKRGMQAAGADRAIVHLSASNCTKGHRFVIASGSQTSKPYQGQRKSGQKPANWEHLREWLEGYEGPLFKVKIWTDREADDGIAYCTEAAYTLGRPGAVMSADKDFRMFAGVHVVWRTLQVVEIQPGTYDQMFAGKQYGHKFFWLQMIMGDPADNIVGLPGCGEVAAEKTLDGTSSNQDAMTAVVALYKKRMTELWAQHFVEQASLLWMRTDSVASPTDFLKIADYPAEVREAAAQMVERLAQKIGRV